jgi:hypothetical protein
MTLPAITTLGSILFFLRELQETDMSLDTFIPIAGAGNPLV